MLYSLYTDNIQYMKYKQNAYTGNIHIYLLYILHMYIYNIYMYIYTSIYTYIHTISPIVVRNLHHRSRKRCLVYNDNSNIFLHAHMYVYKHTCIYVIYIYTYIDCLNECIIFSFNLFYWYIYRKC